MVHATSLGSVAFVAAKIPAFAGGDNMQTILPSEFKRQMVLMLDGAPHVVEDMHTSGTAQTRHRLHTRVLSKNSNEGNALQFRG